jgi:glycosyltransferase involved in cell wall biosynthesis
MRRTRPPPVSVIVPVYNGAGTIAATIDSILRQDFHDFELIVVDDGSTDELRDVLSTFDDARIELHSFENRGLAASRNRGIELAAGTYIACIDADDMWTPDKLGEQLRALEGHPEAALAYSLTDHVDERGRFVGHGSHVTQSGDVFETLLAGNFLENGSNPMIRRGVFERVGPFDENLNAGEDWDMYLRIAFEYPIVCVPKAQILYRVHAGAMSSDIDRQERACLRVFDNALRRLPEGAGRDRLDRLGRANLNRYFARRVITTAANRRATLRAFRYIWRWVAGATDRLAILPKASIQLVKATVLSVLPHSAARPLLARLEEMTRRKRPSDWTR